MFILKKLITPFLLPPGLLVTVCFGLALWSPRRRRSSVRPCVFAAAGIIIWIFSAPAFHALLLRPLEGAYAQPRDLSADAIVVLGGSLLPGVSEQGAAAPDLDSSARLLAALRLHRRTGLPIILSGGGYFGGGSWAPAAAATLIQAGVPPGKTIEESRSRDTCENARFTAEMFARKGWKKALLVTSARHMPRSVYSFGRAGLAAVTPVPCGYMAPRGRPGWLSLLPAGGLALKAALHEYLGLAWYRASCRRRG